jgi:Tol biopolymer transport system component
MRPRRSFPVHLVTWLLVLTALGGSSATARAAARTRIVYASNGALLVVSARGGSPQRIASVPESTLDMSASADGRRIALIANHKLKYPRRGSIRSIYLYRAGRGLRLVKRLHTVAPVSVAISPNGRLIAFGRASEIWVMRPHGRGARQVTRGPGTAWDPVFTPNGRSLVFDRDANRRPQLFRVSLGGGREARLTNDEARSPAVSSRGRVVYIRSAEGPVPERMIVMNLDGGARRTIAKFNDPIFDQSPTFSPDGRGIAFRRLWERTGYASTYRYSIHTMTAGGRHRRKLLGGLRSTARHAPFAGHAPAGPLWIPVS